MTQCRYLIGSMLLFAVASVAALADPPPCNCGKGYYEKVVTAYKQVCREEKYPVVVKQPYMRYEMKPIKTVVMVPKEFVVKKPKQISVPEETTVTQCRKVPVKMMDPDTGCCIITYKNEFYPVKIIVQKMQTIMVDCTVRRDVPEERTVMQSVPVWDCREETIIMTRQRCEMVPYQKIVRCPCPPPGPNYRVPVPLDGSYDSAPGYVPGNGSGK